MFRNVIRKYLTVENYQLFAHTLERLDKGENLSFALEFAQVNKYSKQNIIKWERDELEEFAVKGKEICFHYWTLCDIIRGQLLVTIQNWEKNRYYQTIQNCYKRGDNKEQSSILKALSLLENPQDFCRTANDAIRTNIPEILASLACGNPYPRRYFTTHEFNNMVLKCIFMGIPVSQILLEENSNQELIRMVNEYIDEREAAKRDVPSDIWLIVSCSQDEKHQQRMYRYLEGNDENHRYWVATAMGKTKEKHYISELEKQLKQENNTELRTLIETNIEKLRKLP